MYHCNNVHVHDFPSSLSSAQDRLVVWLSNELSPPETQTTKDPSARSTKTGSVPLLIRVLWHSAPAVLWSSDAEF